MKISQNTPFIIYGAGEVGNNTAINLLKKGYHVQGFLDVKQGCKSAINDVKVYQVDQEIPWDTTKSVVIIALANGNIHRDVAEKLYQKGYLFIVFLPLNHFLSQEIKRNLIIEYNDILEGKCEDFEIHHYNEYTSSRLRCKDGIIQESDDFIWSFVPQEIMFSENFDTWKGDKSKLTGIGDSYDRNIVLRKWNRNLFRYFDNETESSEGYFEVFSKEKSSIDKEAILNERQRLFRLYKMEFNRGMDFFIQTAPLVEWNDKGHYFNLIGGHHRTVFLLEQGLKAYPAKMSRGDFEKWCNQEMLEKWNSYIAANENNLAIPIPHPAYANYFFERENMKVTLLDSILTYFAETPVKNFSVLDVSEADGYFARIFSRLGVSHVTCCEANNSDRIRELFALLYIDGINLTERLEGNVGAERYDIVFAVNPAATVYQNEEILFRLLDLAEKYMLIELPYRRNDKLQYYMQKGNFRSYKLISFEVIEGAKYAVYVLVK